MGCSREQMGMLCGPVLEDGLSSEVTLQRGLPCHLPQQMPPLVPHRNACCIVLSDHLCTLRDHLCSTATQRKPLRARILPVVLDTDSLDLAHRKGSMITY